MRHPWEARLRRWVEAGLLDPQAAERIRAYESAASAEHKFGWPVRIALAFGGLLIAAGVLLFVAAHWDRISPAARFSLVLLLVAVFHAGGALVAERFAALATVLHAVGTASLGAGIYLGGQIFHLEEHWPGALLLWSVGAAVAWWLLRDHAQMLFTALLVPIWLVGEWIVAAGHNRHPDLILPTGIILLSITYLGARRAGNHPGERVLTLLGGGVLVPGVLFAIFEGWEFGSSPDRLSAGLRAAGWTVAIGLPLALAWVLRRGGAWVNVLWAVWALVLGFLALELGYNAPNPVRMVWSELGIYAWCALGAVGMTAWGWYEARRERIDLGAAGFALTVVIFYFSNVMDKMGRATSLIGLGALFLIGGWLLERTRRRLVAGVKERSA